MKTAASLLPATVAVVVLALCCWSAAFAVPVPDGQLRQADRDAGAAPPQDEPFDPSLEALADAKTEDDADDERPAEDREKRQLSFVQGKLLNFLKPLPVVDVIKEEDKYGNDGDKFNRIGRGVIGGVETVSNMLTSALSFPVDTAKKLSRTATEMLNNLGGRLIGLQ